MISLLLSVLAAAPLPPRPAAAACPPARTMPRAAEAVGPPATALPDVSEGELLYFPPYCVICGRMAELDLIIRTCVLMQKEDRTDPWFWQELEKPAREAYEAWSLLEQAYDLPPPINPNAQRRRLEDLRGLIGPDAYYRRQLPDVPRYAPRLWAPWVR